MQRIGADLERLARRAAARSGLIEQLRRTDSTVVESLPDPLIVLAEDRGVRRANSAARAAFGADMPAVLRHPDLRAAIDRAFVSGMTQTAEVTLPVPVAREVRAAVVPMDPRMADAPSWCCPIARASAPSNACAPTSSPMSAMSCAPRSLR
jgi:two-component system phosphate regulon sensor histidine kinase PhoR